MALQGSQMMFLSIARVCFAQDDTPDSAPGKRLARQFGLPGAATGLLEHVSAIIPAYNEEDIISETVTAALSISAVSQVIVVDDGSDDGTAEAARSAGADLVIELPHNLGKGGALNRAWPSATGQVLLLLDADLGASAVEGEHLLEPVLHGDADMTVALFSGSRESPRRIHDDACGLAARSGGFGTVVKTARLGIRLLTGKWVRSPLAGQRALKREIIERTGGFSAKFGVEVGLTVDALRMGYRVVEVPVDMVHRASGRDIRGFVHRGRQMADMLTTLGRKALRI